MGTAGEGEGPDYFRMRWGQDWAQDLASDRADLVPAQCAMAEPYATGEDCLELPEPEPARFVLSDTEFMRSRHREKSGSPTWRERRETNLGMREAYAECYRRLWRVWVERVPGAAVEQWRILTSTTSARSSGGATTFDGWGFKTRSALGGETFLSEKGAFKALDRLFVNKVKSGRYREVSSGGEE